MRRYHTIEETPISMPCVTTGNPAPAVTWQKAGFSGLLNNQNGFEVDEDGTLTVLRPTATHNGIYRCSASNPAGNDYVDLELDVYCKLILVFFIWKKSKRYGLVQISFLNLASEMQFLHQLFKNHFVQVNKLVNVQHGYKPCWILLRLEFQQRSLLLFI